MNASVLSIRILSLLERMPASKQDVHLLRTTIRRLEVQLANPPAKLAKSLRNLRKKAGKVRDIDVHLTLLKRPLSPPASADHDTISAAQEKLREILKARHDRHLGSLQDAVTDARPHMEAKLPILAERAALRVPNARSAHRQTSQARQRFLHLSRRVPKDAAQLHQLRIQTKKLRYSLEPLEAFEESVELVAKFKQVQDAIGSWHDWATLAELAQRKLPSSDAEPLCAVLQARAAREYAKAHHAVQSVRSWMGGGNPVASVAAASEPQKLIRKAG